MLILLSPSKTIRFKDGYEQIAQTTPDFLQEASKLVSTLQKTGSKLQNVLGVSKALTDENRQRYEEWENAQQTNTCPAAWAYRGETFFGLSAESFSEDSLAFAQTHLRIVSGLYGLLRPRDAIAPYRLEMSTKLSGAWGKNLYAYWGNTLTKHVARQQPDFILNCASKEYTQAVVTKTFPSSLSVVTPTFLHEEKSKMAFSKYSRGLLARWAIEHKLSQIEDLSYFDAEGYQLDTTRSTPLNPVFVAPASFSIKGRFTKT